jgi:hypothetical protein
MAQKKEYPPLKDAIKSLENAMRVFTRECASGSTWTRLHTLSDRILERRATLEIVYKRQFPANQKPTKLSNLNTEEILNRAKAKLAEREVKK